MMAANLGRLGEAIAQMRRALELDPFGMTANQDLGRILYFARRYDEAIQQLRHTLDIAPNAYWARIYLGFAYVELERFKEALAVFDSDPPLRAFVLGRMGQADEARQALQHRKRSSGRDRTWLALLHLSLGENERAIEHLRRASEQHEVAYLEMCPKVQPLFEPLRTYPEFDALPPA
jgi:serine/threonine-protein kinase